MVAFVENFKLLTPLSIHFHLILNTNTERVNSLNVSNDELGYCNV